MARLDKARKEEGRREEGRREEGRRRGHPTALPHLLFTIAHYLKVIILIKNNKKSVLRTPCSTSFRK